MLKTLVYSNNLKYELPDGRAILDGINFSVSSIDRIGLVGRNGSGKSTLLKLIRDAAANSREDISFSTGGAVGYLPQIDLDLYKKDLKLFEFLESRDNEFWWDILTKVKEIFATDIDLETKLSALSGGEITKILFAEVLSQSPTLLLLDEPTNHLDANTTERLKLFLKEYNGAVVFASHNISFLNSLATQIWELEEGKLRVFSGNYDGYKSVKDAEFNSQKRRFESSRKELNKINNSIRLEFKRAQRVKSKGLKESKLHDRSIPKIVRGRLIEMSQKSAAQNMELLQRRHMETSQKLSEAAPKTFKKAYLDIQTEPKRGRLFELKNTQIQIKDKILINNVNLTLSYGERIAITGDNGTGKTLLAKKILENLDTHVKGMYLSQKYEIVNPGKTLIENIFLANPDIGYEKARKVLGNFLFITDDDINKKASVLSGGEIARLAMAIITAKPLDILILDEPTNHLDIYTIEMILSALQQFQGGLVAISHDQSFLNKVGLEQIYEIEGGTLKAS